MTEDFSLAQYDFDLPPAQIAQHPAARREASRLMLLQDQLTPSHHVFHELPQLLSPGDVIVRNNTKVIPARLRCVRSGGGKSELLLVHPIARATASLRDSLVDIDAPPGPQWLCLGRPAAHLKAGKRVTIGEDDPLVATIVAQLGGGRVVVAFDVEDDAALMARVEILGEIPLPPYIERTAGNRSSTDAERYQTTFAKTAGAVAAPTAGLHFTADVDAALQARGVDIVHLTLHVGPGTFRPMIAEDIREHIMDAEFYTVSDETAKHLTQARQAGRRIIAVGTTSTRTLESVTDEKGVTHAGQGWTDLFIRPGYHFKAIQGLLTNFHLPKSSLLVLVSALIGRERALAAYHDAIQSGYRFYSYGDAMLLLPGS